MSLSWECVVCTFADNSSFSTECELCCTLRGSSELSAAASSAQQGPSSAGALAVDDGLVAAQTLWGEVTRLINASDEIRFEVRRLARSGRELCEGPVSGCAACGWWAVAAVEACGAPALGVLTALSVTHRAQHHGSPPSTLLSARSMDHRHRAQLPLSTTHPTPPPHCSP